MFITINQNDSTCKSDKTNTNISSILSSLFSIDVQCIVCNIKKIDLSK